MPIKPGIVKIKTSLKSGFAKALLANSITMTPGTITVDIIDDDIFVHWIFIHSGDPAVYTKIITGKFEEYIKKFAE
jgi:multicomponent Na+:H+ antiporter subunit E